MPRDEEVVRTPIPQRTRGGSPKPKDPAHGSMMSRARDAVAEMLVDWLRIDGGAGPKWKAYRRFCEWYRQQEPNEQEAITNIALRQWVLSLPQFLEAWDVAVRILGVEKLESSYRKEGLF